MLGPTAYVYNHYHLDKLRDYSSHAVPMNTIVNVYMGNLSGITVSGLYICCFYWEILLYMCASFYYSNWMQDALIKSILICWRNSDYLPVNSIHIIVSS